MINNRIQSHPLADTGTRKTINLQSIIKLIEDFKKRMEFFFSAYIRDENKKREPINASYHLCLNEVEKVALMEVYTKEIRVKRGLYYDEKHLIIDPNILINPDYIKKKISVESYYQGLWIYKNRIKNISKLVKVIRIIIIYLCFFKN